MKRRTRAVFDILASLAIVAVLVVLTRGARDIVNPPERIGGGALRIIDGDSLVLEGREIRLQGIDAPELDQNCADADGAAWRCGREARAALERLAQRGLECESRSRDRYRRAIARCRDGQGDDIGKALLRGGWAVALPHYALAGYRDAEAAAREARRGIWRGPFQRPAEWRNAHNAEFARNTAN